MTMVSITPMYAAVLGLILLVLSVRVVAVVRGKGEVGLGDGGNPDFTAVVRAQGNFTEYVPLILILIAFAEAGGTSSGMIHGLGSALVLGRIAHPIGMTPVPGINPFRLSGSLLTFGTLAVASVIVLMNSLG